MPNLTSSRAVVGVIEPDHGLMKNKKIAYATLTVAAVDLTLNALHGMFRLPKNSVIVGIILKASDLDTNGTPTITLSVGDSGNTARYLSASTVAQAGGVVTTLAVGGMFYKLTVDTLITVLVAAAAATGAAGTIELSLEYYVDI